MRFIHFLTLAITVILVFASITVGTVTDEHTVDEWRSILAVHDDEGMMTGLQISLNIVPDQYYLQVGTPVNLTGKITNVFGPLGNVPVTLAVGNDQKPVANVTLTTNEEGEFSGSEIVNHTGTIRYQVWFEGTDRKDINLTKSPEIEITGIPGPLFPEEGEDNLTDPGRMNPGTHSGSNGSGVSVGPPEQQTGAGDRDLYVLPESGMNQTATGSITLQADTGSFSSGQNVTFSGVVTGQKQTPLAYAVVDMEMAYGNESYTKIGDSLLTELDGTYVVSFHFTGPDSPVFHAVSSDESGNILKSDDVTLTFTSGGFAPPSRIRQQTRTIEADLSPSVIWTGENITLSGWFADGNGNAISPGRLNLYWYNFLDKIWDRYEPGADVITSRDGYYAINVSGPKMTGITFVAIVSKYEENRKPLFSQALPLTVRNVSDSVPEVLPPFLEGFSVPDEVPVLQPAAITFRLTDPTGNPMSGEPIQVFFSEDGFTWFISGNPDLITGPEGMFTFNDTPKQPGFHYYRGVFNGTESMGPVESGIVVLAITGNETALK